MTQKTAIVTAADQEKFEFATLYQVTYPGQSDMDSNVPWNYVQRLTKQGYTVIFRNRDGSAA